MAGKITEFLVEEDSTVSVGQDLLKMEPGEGGGDASDSQPSGAARSEAKNAEDGNKDQAAPAAASEKGASEDTHKKQEEKAPNMSSSEQEKPAPRTDEKQGTGEQPAAPAPSPKKEEKAPKQAPKPEKAVGSRNETRVSVDVIRHDDCCSLAH